MSWIIWKLRYICFSFFACLLINFIFFCKYFHQLVGQSNITEQIINTWTLCTHKCWHCLILLLHWNSTIPYRSTRNTYAHIQRFFIHNFHLYCVELAINPKTDYTLGCGTAPNLSRKRCFKLLRKFLGIQIKMQA